MNLEKFLTIYNSPIEITPERKQKLLEEFDYFNINFDLWQRQTIFVEENNPNKSLDYDERLFNFLDTQEQNIMNLVKLKDQNLQGKLYFNFVQFWKENYFRMASKKLSNEISSLVKKYCN